VKGDKTPCSFFFCLNGKSQKKIVDLVLMEELKREGCLYDFTNHDPSWFLAPDFFVVLRLTELFLYAL
jgi:hypothetical protein